MKREVASFEAETIPGLESYALEELSDRFRPAIGSLYKSRSGFIRFRYRGSPESLRKLRSVVAVYRIHNFEIPRPKAFLGHEHFTRMTAILRKTMASFEKAPRTIGIGAAGSQSSVLRRLRQELADNLKLAADDDGKGDLFVRLAPRQRGIGWEFLVREAERPLSKRNYRVADVPGALNATAAYAMTCYGTIPNEAIVVNLCSGSSTILIEHSIARPDDSLIAIDNSRRMLDAGEQNARAAGRSEGISHVLADAGHTPLPANSVDMIYADLPFGLHIGTHKDNLQLYPAVLREAQRIATRRAAFVVLTHEVKLLRSNISGFNWRIADERVINLRGLHPRLFVLNQNSATIVK